jgi:hypothetical protein
MMAGAGNAYGPGSITLHESVRQTTGTKLLRTESPGEKTSIILVRLQLNNPGTVQCCRNKLHLSVRGFNDLRWLPQLASTATGWYSDHLPLLGLNPKEVVIYLASPDQVLKLLEPGK